MRISERAFRGNEDLFTIGRLIRRAYAQAPYRNAWSFARFDIWAQRRIADERVHGRRGWQQGIRLWEGDGGELVGAVLFENDRSAALIVAPDQPEMAADLLTWAEAHYAEQGVAKRPLRIETVRGNATQEELLRSRDYVRGSGHYLHREKPLGDAGPEPVVVPDGFVLKPMETLEEMEQFHLAVKAVFGFEDSVSVYQIVQQAPSYVRELDLVVLSPGGEVASFCTVWLDAESGIAELEPVGTVEAYRKQGLAAALIAEASNGLRSLGCGKVTVNSWSESTGANRLYEAAGLRARARIDNWERKG